MRPVKLWRFFAVFGGGMACMANLADLVPPHPNFQSSWLAALVHLLIACVVSLTCE